MSGNEPTQPSPPTEQVLPEWRTRLRRSNSGRWLDDLLAPPEFYSERDESATSWLEAILQPVCLVTIITSFLAGFIHFGLSFAPTWNTIMLIPMIIIAATIAYLYSRRLARSQTIWKELLILLMPVLLIVRFAPYIEWGFNQLLSDLGLWFKEPIEFLDPTFVVNTLIVLAAWQIAFDAAQTLNILRPLKQEVAPEDQSSVAYYLWESSDYRNIDRLTPLRSLTSRWLWGGVVLLFLDGMASIGVPQILSPDAFFQLISFARPGLVSVYFNIVLYFVAGLILISQAQFTRLRSTWHAERIQVTPNMANRWFLLLACFMGLAFAVALLLPTDQTEGLQELVRYGLYLLSQLVAFLYFAIFTVIGLILAPFLWLLSLFGQGSSTATPPPPPPPQIQPPPGGSNDTLGFLRSMVLWIFITILIGYALWQAAVRTGVSRLRLPAWGILRIAGSAFGWLWHLFRGMGRAAGEGLSDILGRLRRQPDVPRQPFRFISLRRLGPRQLVEYFYLSILERAARLGHGRVPGQTASEFTATLQARLPEVDPDLDRLTAAFLEARYSPHSFGESEAKTARTIWQRLRERLQQRRRLSREAQAKEER